ncbi:VOC family protein [Iamia majanohamensis]|uniref:VOC family protein n=1 Tax=Iamia majanohamensis TaxID=467976 RepID=A0AAE9Y300_9ACTN|nr:VOC family protein [Iamia majanohamensis]WCO65330.1 VOC family protein [Iamia majanohamensis]
MAHLRDVTFDCRHPASLARFWAEALEGYAVAPYDEAELERLRDLGVEDPEDDPTVLVVGPVGAPRIFFQRVPEAKVVKNRVHLDLVADDADAEADRLEALGATRQEAQPDDRFIVLGDPEGNELCLMRAVS